MKRISIVLTLLLVATAVVPELVQACPNCKEAYMADGETPVSSGFNASIVFMMIMPFVVIGGFAFRLWLAQRRKQSGSTTG